MTGTAARAAVAPWRPSVRSLARQRFVLELRAFWRVREEVVFTFALPIMLLALFATIFGGEIEQTGVDVSQYYVAGMLAATGMTAGFQSLTAQLALEQDDGTLKRLAGTPMPKSAYVLGKVGLVCVVATGQAATMFTLGVIAFGVSLPKGDGWLIFASVFAISLGTWTMLGMAFSRLVASPRAGSAVSVPPTLVLQFISGVFIFFSDIPAWLRNVASVFPLRWAALGMRHALLPDGFRVVEPDGSWQTGKMYAVLCGWLVLSAVFAGTFFRWRVRE